ncbi:ABC transporter permease [Neosynechococcus sphagnicola]|uniref:ABC transporter permease n=1 Tax=Neosynechococcus sphagnicola TaxID=1501145 RepID=UPI001EF9E862|nr:ABC transporter permease [Neosynechococcus sphagnicola]
MRIEPSRGWGSLHLAELWDYRDLIYMLLWRQIQGNYRQMALGPLWIVINPLITMLLYTLIFGVVANLPSDGLPYPIFIYTALLPWNFFSEGASGASRSLVNQQGLISKVYFPRLVVPIVGVLSGLVNFFASMIILIGLMAIFRIAPTARVLTLPLFLLLATATALSVGLWFAALIVRFRDVSTFLGYLLQGWMYATPVVYSIQVIPEQWHFLYRLNPMVGVIEGFRWALLGTKAPPLVALILPVSFVGVSLISGAYYFRHTERNIIDIV